MAADEPTVITLEEEQVALVVTPDFKIDLYIPRKLKDLVSDEAEDRVEIPEYALFVTAVAARVKMDPTFLPAQLDWFAKILEASAEN